MELRRAMILEEVARDFYIAAFRPVPIPVDAWQEVLDAAASAAGNRRTIRLLMRMEGDGPNVRQRAALGLALAGGHAKVAVLTMNVVARGAVTALRWVGEEVDSRAFGPHDHLAALAHLDAGYDGEVAHRRLTAAYQALDAPSPRPGMGLRDGFRS